MKVIFKNTTLTFRGTIITDITSQFTHAVKNRALNNIDTGGTYSPQSSGVFDVTNKVDISGYVGDIMHVNLVSYTSASGTRPDFGSYMFLEEDGSTIVSEAQIKKSTESSYATNNAVEIEIPSGAKYAVFTIVQDPVPDGVTSDYEFSCKIYG